MANAISLAYRVAAMRERYQRIHDAVFKLSLRRVLPIPGYRTRIDYAAHETDLIALHAEIVAICNEVKNLEDQELTKRSGKEIRDSLRGYVSCLKDTVSRLQEICTCFRLEQDDSRRFTRYRESRYLADVTAYDESIQKYKKLGKRLNELFASY